MARRAEDVTSEPPDSDDERSFEPILAASVVLGFVFGGVTMIAMFAMFPMTAQGWMLPLANQKSWNPPILIVASAVVMVVAYVTLRRRGAVEVADRIFLGYVAALAMAAGVEIAREMFFIVRAHVPQNLGVTMRRTHAPTATCGRPVGIRSGRRAREGPGEGHSRSGFAVVPRFASSRDPRSGHGTTRGETDTHAPSRAVATAREANGIQEVEGSTPFGFTCHSTCYAPPTQPRALTVGVLSVCRPAAVPGWPLIPNQRVRGRCYSRTRRRGRTTRRD